MNEDLLITLAALSDRWVADSKKRLIRYQHSLAPSPLVLFERQTAVRLARKQRDELLALVAPISL